MLAHCYHCLLHDCQDQMSPIPSIGNRTGMTRVNEFRTARPKLKWIGIQVLINPVMNLTALNQTKLPKRANGTTTPCWDLEW